MDTAERIKREIYKNGPVIGSLPLYRDFFLYKDGIYHAVDGTLQIRALHLIKIIGWDKDDKLDK